MQCIIERVPTCVLDSHDAPTVALVGLCLGFLCLVMVGVAIAAAGEHGATHRPRSPGVPRPRGASRVKG